MLYLLFDFEDSIRFSILFITSEPQFSAEFKTGDEIWSFCEFISDKTINFVRGEYLSD